MTKRQTRAGISRRTFVTGAAACAFAMPTGLVRASGHARPVGVVELFTSQGCSSCPPADAALAEFAADPDVLALGYHVDYWDYLGWRDTLASADNTARQYAYARTLGSRTVYTPQAVLNGRQHLNGGKKAEIRTLLSDMARQGEGLPVPMTVDANAQRLRVTVDAGEKPGGYDFLLGVVYFRDRSEVRIERGENAGRAMVYANAVTGRQSLGMWDGAAMTVDLPRSKLDQHKATGCAVLLQAHGPSGDPGSIIGAANLTGWKQG